MPLKQKLNESKTVEIQCTAQFDDDEESQVMRGSPFKNAPQVEQSVYSSVSCTPSYVDQLRNNFEEELARQYQVFEMQLIGK